MAKQSALETAQLGHRPVELERNDYNQQKEYKAGVPDQVSDGDVLGKGSPDGKTHTHWTPDINVAQPDSDGVWYSAIDRRNFNTREQGGALDIYGRDDLAFTGRNRLLGINNYREGDETEYSKKTVSFPTGYPQYSNPQNPVRIPVIVGPH